MEEARYNRGMQPKTKPRKSKSSVRLGHAQEQFIGELIASGRFATRDEVVRHALQRWREAGAPALQPFTAEEARRAFQPDCEADAFAAHVVKHTRLPPPEE